MITKDKYQKAELPNKDNALLLANSYDTWAKEAIENDKYGTARQFELMALLLRFYGQSERDVSSGDH